MSEDTGDTRGQLLNFPTPGDVLNQPPQLADPGRLFPAVNEGADIPPESPEETTMELPPIPAAPNPAAALHSEVVPAAGADEESGEYGEGEYVQPRSLADHLGDWLEFRLERARDLHVGEASFREAEIARKAAMLEARTAQEVAMMEHNGKLHAAMMKAKADKTAARGRADADRTRASGSGMGADKGRSKAGGGGGGGSSGGSGRGAGGGRGSGGGNSPKGTGNGSDRSAGGRGNGSKGNESSGGSKGRHNSPGKGGGSGDGGKSSNSSASSPAAERARGRQERAAHRQAARQERRSAAQTADLADRTKDRDQARANKQAAREERRAAKAERAAAKQAKRDADAGRTTLGAAVTEEAQRRWDKRRADAKDEQAAPKAGPQKVNLSKDKDAKDAKDGNGKGTSGKGAPGAASSGRKDVPGGASAAGGGASGGFGPGATGGRPWDSPFGPEEPVITVDRPDRPTDPPRVAEDGEDDIVDAVIVDDPADPFGAYVSRPAGLPPAPEPHTQRPGTTRPTAQENTVNSEVNKTAGQAGMAAKHRTDITFDEYLMEIVNIAIAAGLDQEYAENLAVALGKVADALRDMAADLVGDHNIATEVTAQISDLADAATRMKLLAERCATECEVATEAARLAAVAVGRTYSQDIQAMDEAGLAHASAAAHHD